MVHTFKPYTSHDNVASGTVQTIPLWKNPPSLVPKKPSTIRGSPAGASCSSLSVRRDAENVMVDGLTVAKDWVSRYMIYRQLCPTRSMSSTHLVHLIPKPVEDHFEARLT